MTEAGPPEPALPAPTGLTESDALARLREAERLQGEGRWAEAVSALRPVFQAQPDHAPARVRLARIHAASGAVRLAIEVLDEVLAREPGRSEAAALREVLQGGAAGARASLPADPFDRPSVARRLEAAGRIAAAAGVWERLIGRHPEAAAEAARLRGGGSCLRDRR